MSDTIAKNVADRLRQQIGQGAGSVSVDGDGVTVNVDVEQCERYASGVRGIQVTPAQPGGDVRGVAERIVEGVTAIGDPLAIVECEPRAGQAIVRSAEPETDEGGVTYWEADVRQDGTSLHRYRKDHSQPEREVITEPLPHGAVGKIAEQLADAVKQ
jgi:hypothetical protein